MVAPIEVLSAEAEVATREADILQAQMSVTNSEDLLRTIINMEAEEGAGGADCSFDEPTRNPGQSAWTKLSGPPSTCGRTSRPAGWAEEQGDQSCLRQKPDSSDLNIYTSYWSPGISGHSFSTGQQPLTGVVVGRIPGGAGAALSDALGLRYENWSFGVQLNVPVSFFTSRAQYQASKIGYEQSLVDLEDLEQRIFWRSGLRPGRGDQLQRVQGYRPPGSSPKKTGGRGEKTQGRPDDELRCPPISEDLATPRPPSSGP